MIFIPAISGSFVLKFGELPLEYLWWREECPIYIPYVLISYGNVYLFPEIRENTREVAKISKDVKVMVDSGGFQIYSRGIKIDVESLTNWQLRMGDYIIGLDYPIEVGKSLQEVIKHAEISYNNYKLQIKLMNNLAKERYFIVLHGNDDEQMEKWWEIAIEPLIDDVFGVAYAPRIKTPINVFNGLKFLYKKGVKRVHLLAATGYKLLTTIKLFDKYFEFLSTDSSTHTIQASKGSILIPYARSTKSGRFGYKGLRSGIKYDTLSCICPVCRRFCDTQLYSLAKLNTVSRYAIASLHNLFWIYSFKNYLEWLDTLGEIELFASKFIPKTYTLFKNMSKSTLGRWL